MRPGPQPRSLNRSGKRKEPLPQITRKQRLPTKSINLMLKLNLIDRMTKVNKKGVGYERGRTSKE